MISIQDGRQELFQWDTGRKLTVPKDCSQVHYSNRPFGAAITVEAYNGVADIPDELLQSGNDLYCWAFVGTAEDGYTKIEKKIKVQKKSKPHDYVYTPTQQMTLGEVVERVNKVEKQSQDVIDRIESGELRGEQGPPGPQGPKGEGASSWKDLTDKPFYETVQNLGDTITWDGTPTEDVVNLPTEEVDFDIELFRISENTPTIEELQTGRLTALQGDVDVDFNVSELMCVEAIPGITLVASDGTPLLVVVKHDNFSYEQEGIAFSVEKSGVYSVCIYSSNLGVLAFVSSLTIPNYNFTKTEIKKLDPKFLPDGGVGYSYKTSVKDTLTWNGEPSDTVVGVFTAAMHHVSDNVPSIEEMQNCSVVINGIVDGEPVTQQFVPGADDVISLSDKAFMLVFEGELPVLGVTTEDNCIVEFGSFIVSFPKKGIYFLSAGADAFSGIDQMQLSSLTIEGYTFTKEVTRKIDEKYLPGILPEVVLTTPIDYAFTSFTDAENAAITAVASMNMPAIFKGTLWGMPLSVILNNANGFGMVGTVFGMIVVLRKDEDGKWYPYSDDYYEDIDRLRSEVIDVSIRVEESESNIAELQKNPVVPKATASDNGKFLQVVDGKYALVELQDVSEEGL